MTDKDRFEARVKARSDARLACGVLDNGSQRQPTPTGKVDYWAAIFKHVRQNLSPWHQARAMRELECVMGNYDNPIKERDDDDEDQGQ